MTRNLLLCLVVLSTIISCKKKVNESSIAVTGFFPDSDGVGATVIIYGNDFGNNSANVNVSFNGRSATIDSCSDSVLVVVIPTGATTGPVTISSRGYQTYKSGSNYSILTGTWVKKAAFPGPARVNATTFSINNIGYVVGGISQSGSLLSDMYAYDPSADSWTKKASLPGTGKCDAFGLTLGNNAYLIGGLDTYPGIDYLADVWEYDPNADVWTQMNNFPGTPRQGPAGFSLGNIGYYGLGSAGMDWWRYDPTADTWTRKADFSYQTYQANYGFYFSGTGYLLTFGDDQNWVSYDTTADQWQPGTVCPSYVEPDGLACTAGNLGFYLTGAGRLPQTWVYNPTSATWARNTSLPNFRGGSVAVGLNNSMYYGLGVPYSNLTATPWPTDWWIFKP